MITKIVIFQFNIPFEKNLMVSARAINLIKKHTGQEEFRFGDRDKKILNTQLTLRVKKKNNLNNLILKIVKILKESKELKKHNIDFIKAE